MNKSLQNMIDRYKKGLLETLNLQIRNETFLTEIICDECLESFYFKNLSFSNLNCTNINFESSFFQDCLFTNCIFENTSFQDAEFENCNLINCQIKNSNLTRVDFSETVFDKCCFEKVDLVQGWFKSCDFRATNFKAIEGKWLIQTAVVDSKFFKFNKSIEFKGEFFLIDILHPTTGIDSN